jgi:hypothetical protein
MQGNVVSAAKWLGASMVLASIILVAGLHWVLSLQGSRLTLSVRLQRERTENALSERVEHLLGESEKLRQAGDEHERFWLLDQPSHMMPFRTRDGSVP